MLVGNGVGDGRRKRNKFAGLLAGVLRSAGCDRDMAHLFYSKWKRRYRYYVRCNAIQRGRNNCPSPFTEKFVVEEIKGSAHRLTSARITAIRASGNVQRQRVATDARRGLCQLTSRHPVQRPYRSWRRPRPCTLTGKPLRRRSDPPIICPVRMPPLAITAVLTRGQWLRPYGSCNVGERPNSPHAKTDTSS